MIKEKSKKLYTKAVNWIRRKGYQKIRAKVDDFNDPKSFYRKRDNETFTPDLSASQYGQRSYFDIALKSENRRRLISKWTLLSDLANMKGGDLYLFAPHGHKAFAERIVERHNIDANVVKI
jgi:hypothetical protein